MIFIQDTREQPGKHDNVENYLKAHGHTIIRSKMYVGDLSLLNDQSVCVDFKNGLSEVYANLVNHNEHMRFRRECERAHEANIRLIVLVQQNGISSLAEVRQWINPRIKRWDYITAAQSAGKLLDSKVSKKPPIESIRLENIMRTMSERYEFEWLFCTKAAAGKIVEDIFYDHTRKRTCNMDGDL